MNDMAINWQNLNKGLHIGRRAVEDKAPTVDGVKKLLEYPDIRIKLVVLMIISSGSRVVAFDYLKWKHIVPICYEKENIIAAKMIIYSGDREECFTFITTEAYDALKDWMGFRLYFGEQINGNHGL